MHGYVHLPDRFRKQKQQQEKLQHCTSLHSSNSHSRSGSPERGASLQPWKPAGSISLHATGATEHCTFFAPLHQSQQSRSRPPSPRLHRSSCSSAISRSSSYNKENAVRTSRIFKSREADSGPPSRPQSRADCSSHSVDLRPALKALNDGNNQQHGGAAGGFNSGTRAFARSRTTAQPAWQQGSNIRGSIFKPLADIKTSRGRSSQPLVATSSFSVSAILAGNGSASSTAAAAATAEASSRAMLWQPLAGEPLSMVSDQPGSPWRQARPALSPAATRYAAQQQCSSSSSEHQPSSTTSSCQSVRLRHTTPLDMRQQQVQQQLRQSCQQLQELARLLSSPQQLSTHGNSLAAVGSSDAGSASRWFAGSSSGYASSLNISQHTCNQPEAAAAMDEASSCSTSLGAALQAAEACLGLPAESDAAAGLGTLQQLASAISQAAAPSAAWTVESAAYDAGAENVAENSCTSSYNSIHTQRCTPSPDECTTPAASAGTGAARVFGDSPVGPVSSPPPSQAHQPRLQLLHCDPPASSVGAASAAAASYKDLLDKCQVSERAALTSVARCSTCCIRTAQIACRKRDKC